MTKDIIQFSHANGFPALCYRYLFSLLEDQYEVQYIDMLGHDLQFPVADNWTTLAQELIAELDRKQLGPVIGIGHSLGGAITLFAALERPELFKFIVLLDTPIFSFPRAKIVQLFKNLKKAEWITPGGRAKRRRTQWATYEEALNYFRSRPLFRLFNEQCLRDYITYGTLQTEDGFTLKFDPKIESEIYLTLPDNYGKFKNQLQVPGVTIVGDQSEVVKDTDIRSMQKNFHLIPEKISGGHLFPFEYPQKTAILIKNLLKKHFQSGEGL